LGIYLATFENIKMMTYYQCTECNQIEVDSAWTIEQDNKICKHCGTSNKYKLWPSTEIIELFETIRKYNSESFEYGLVSSVFISAALELLLERLLFTMAIENLLYHEVSHLIEHLLDTNQGRSKRLQLYNRLGYESFEKEAKEVGYSQFLKHWNEIAQIRNRSVHGDIEEGTRLKSSLVETTISESLEVFSRLNNKYNMQSIRYDVATAPKKNLDKDLEKLKAWKRQVVSDENIDENS
jgi:hypothetical protein